MKKTSVMILAGLGIVSQLSAEQPNVIVILADDMGYGDVKALNPDSKIPTPNLDEMASRGIVFTDAHASSSLSTPSRYSIITGRYPWRTTLKDGVSNGFSRPMIPPERNTIASMFRRQGYATACIGKWHLGWNWAGGPEQSKIDYAKPIADGPTERGFDYYFGLSASLDMAPFVFVENDMAQGIPSVTLGKQSGLLLFHGGIADPDFEPEACLPTITRKTIEYIESRRGNDQPFFLYMPLTAPHTPVLPSEAFRGRSVLGPYGDFVMMVDDVAGRVYRALERAGKLENTIVVFTSDNGCAPYIGVPDMERKGHFPSYVYRGYKSDAFEGGHRIPLLVTYGTTRRGERFDSLVSLADFYATFAEMTGYGMSAGEAEDSYSWWPVVSGDGGFTPRQHVVAASGRGFFALRQDRMKMIFWAGSGGWAFPETDKQMEGLPALQLYDLDADPGEKVNLIDMPQYAPLVAQMTRTMKQYVVEGRSVPGAPAANDTPNDWKQIEIFMR